MWTQVRKGVKNKLERNVDDLHDIMRKNRERRKKNREEGPGLTPWTGIFHFQYMHPFSLL